MAMEADYDFIVVGGMFNAQSSAHGKLFMLTVYFNLAGAAGAAIASRLAKSPTRPRVLLLEAGNSHTKLTHMVAGARYSFWSTDEASEFNYRYKTEPEPTLNQRQLVYDSGCGLGGSTNINIGIWDFGRMEEMNHWAKLIEDDAWSWKEVVSKMKMVFHTSTFETPQISIEPRSKYCKQLILSRLKIFITGHLKSSSNICYGTQLAMA